MSSHYAASAGSMGRTAEDLVMLDSIVRTKNYSSSGEGMLPTTVPCDVSVNTNLSLAGLRIGLPSTFGKFLCVCKALHKAAWTSMPAVSSKACSLCSAIFHALRSETACQTTRAELGARFACRLGQTWH